ncbi:hypothetical protein HGI79_10950 [Clostridium sp. DJ247]|nr:hypothetical protein [Clostridium sp. DJ247]
MKNINSVDSMAKIEKIINNLSKKIINNLSLAVKFTKRNSKLDGFTFFKAFTFGVYSLQNISLRNIADFCQETVSGLTLSRQALENKLKVGFEFLESILRHIIEDNILKTIKHNHIEIFKIFNDIKICDSSIIKTSDSLRDIYRGFGTKWNSESALKIQTVYSFKNKLLDTFEIEDAILFVYNWFSFTPME